MRRPSGGLGRFEDLAAIEQVEPVLGLREPRQQLPIDALTVDTYRAQRQESRLRVGGHRVLLFKRMFEGCRHGHTAPDDAST